MSLRNHNRNVFWLINKLARERDLHNTRSQQRDIPCTAESHTHTHRSKYRAARRRRRGERKMLRSWTPALLATNISNTCATPRVWCYYCLLHSCTCACSHLYIYIYHIFYIFISAGWRRRRLKISWHLFVMPALNGADCSIAPVLSDI